MQKATPPLADGNPQSKVFYLEPTGTVLLVRVAAPVVHSARASRSSLAAADTTLEFGHFLVLLSRVAEQPTRGY
jgi:hypothetical protein